MISRGRTKAYPGFGAVTLTLVDTKKRTRFTCKGKTLHRVLVSAFKCKRIMLTGINYCLWKKTKNSFLPVNKPSQRSYDFFQRFDRVGKNPAECNNLSYSQLLEPAMPRWRNNNAGGYKKWRDCHQPKTVKQWRWVKANNTVVSTPLQPHNARSRTHEELKQQREQTQSNFQWFGPKS